MNGGVRPVLWPIWNGRIVKRERLAVNLSTYSLTTVSCQQRL